MTTRRDALLALSLLGAGSSPARAQAPKAGQLKRIGYLGLDPDPKTPPAERPLYIAMRKRGWILGHNLVREAIYYADGKIEDLSRFAEELVRKRVDVILCNGDLATVAVARATRTIPIVFWNVLYPVELGLVESYARPGRNATGQSGYAGIGIAVKRLGLLREIVPDAKRLSYLSPGGPQSFETVAGGRFDGWQTLEAATKALGFETRIHPWPRLQDVDIVLSEVAIWRAQAVTAGFGFIYDARKRVADFLFEHRLPGAFFYREVVEAGGLMSYGVGASETAYATERLAEYVDHVLRGRAPADLPVEEPRQYELVINMKTAKALGLTIPRSILLRADQVIE
jgi:putative ABC transport system substrate-binding protein